MSTGYGWESLRQVCATLLGARHVPERLCSGLVYLGSYNKCSPLPFTFMCGLTVWSLLQWSLFTYSGAQVYSDYLKVCIPLLEKYFKILFHR